MHDALSDKYVYSPFLPPHIKTIRAESSALMVLYGATHLIQPALSEYLLYPSVSLHPNVCFTYCVR
mgnify:CR=1 FL=1